MSDETTQPEETPEEQPAAEAAPPAEEAAPAEEIVAEEVVASADADGEPELVVEAVEVDEELLEVEEIEETPRVKPAIPGMDLEVDIVAEGQDPLAQGEGDEDGDASDDDDDATLHEPIAATIELAADARYRATGKRKTAVARVILRPGNGVYTINGRAFDEAFPRETLRRNIRQPLEAVALDERMDVIATLHGGGVSAQAGALRHGISRALLDADPNLRGELKRRGFLTRDARAKERKKAGLKKARKRPQFSKR